MSPGQNPPYIRILRGLQFRERVTRPREDALGNTSLHIAKEFRVAAQRTHHPRETRQEHRPSIWIYRTYAQPQSIRCDVPHKRV